MAQAHVLNLWHWKLKKTNAIQSRLESSHQTNYRKCKRDSLTNDNVIRQLQNYNQNLEQYVKRLGSIPTSQNDAKITIKALYQKITSTKN